MPGMDHKKASQILIQLLEKRLLTADEEVAIQTAVGVLAWTSLSESRIQSLRKQREKQKSKTK